MNPQRRFAPIGGLFKPESVAGLARMCKDFNLRRFRAKMRPPRTVFQIFWSQLTVPMKPSRKSHPADSIIAAGL